MNSEAILAVFEKLDSMNDEEIAGMAFAERRLVIDRHAEHQDW